MCTDFQYFFINFTSLAIFTLNIFVLWYFHLFEYFYFFAIFAYLNILTSLTKTSPLTLIHFHPFHTKSSIFIHLYSYLTIHPSLSLFIIFYPFSLTMSVTTSATLSSLMSTTPNITANIISISIGNSQSHIMKVHHHVQYRGERSIALYYISLISGLEI